MDHVFPFVLHKGVVLVPHDVPTLTTSNHRPQGSTFVWPQFKETTAISPPQLLLLRPRSHPKGTTVSTTTSSSHLPLHQLSKPSKESSSLHNNKQSYSLLRATAVSTILSTHSLNHQTYSLSLSLLLPARSSKQLQGNYNFSMVLRDRGRVYRYTVCLAAHCNYTHTNTLRPTTRRLKVCTETRQECEWGVYRVTHTR
jgi:hypothetical protein